MKIIIIILSIFALYVVYLSASIWYRVQISRKLVEKNQKFVLKAEDMTKTMLVLGDSTAAGVGADTPYRSTPGLIAESYSFTHVDNNSVSGAQAKDLADQISKSPRDKYDLILVQIGANDIVRFHKAKDISNILKPDLEKLTKMSNKVVFITSGNLGGAPLIPFFMKSYYTNLNLEYHKEFENLSSEIGVIYVSTYTDPSIDPFILNPKQYFAQDNFHPSGDGYYIWFEKIKNILDSLK